MRENRIVPYHRTDRVLDSPRPGRPCLGRSRQQRLIVILSTLVVVLTVSLIIVIILLNRCRKTQQSSSMTTTTSTSYSEFDTTDAFESTFFDNLSTDGEINTLSSQIDDSSVTTIPDGGSTES